MSSLYDVGRRSFLTPTTVGAWTGQIDWVGHQFEVALVSQAYADVPNLLSAHRSEADMRNVAGAVVASTPLVNNNATTSGIATANNTVFSAVTGSQVVGVVIYRQNGGVPPVPANNVLVAFINTAISGLPVTPNGGDITILWNGGTGEIFRL